MTSSVVRKSTRRINSRALRSVATLAVSLAFSSLSLACASGAQNAQAQTPARAQGPVSHLRASVRLITNATPSTLGQQYSAALRWAGVEVVPTTAESDVVTELRLNARRDANGQAIAEVTLRVRAGAEQLATATVTYPLNQNASKDDLSALTSALTESPAVRAYAERRGAEKQRRAEAADAAAWQLASASNCAQSSKFADCADVIRYLNGFPSGAHRGEAEQALDQAELVRQRASRDAAIARVKADLEAWKAANPEACRNPEAATSCDGVNAYVAAYPSGRYVPEAKELVAQSQVKLNELSEKTAFKSAMSQRAKTAHR